MKQIFSQFSRCAYLNFLCLSCRHNRIRSAVILKLAENWRLERKHRVYSKGDSKRKRMTQLTSCWQRAKSANGSKNDLVTIVFPPLIRLITFSVCPCKERQKKDGKTSNFKFRLFPDFILGENWDYSLLVNSGARSLKVAAIEPWSPDFLALEPRSPAFLGPEPWSPKPLWDPV